MCKSRPLRRRSSVIAYVSPSVHYRVAHSGEAFGEILAQEGRAQSWVEAGELGLEELDGVGITLGVRIIRREHHHLGDPRHHALEWLLLTQAGNGVARMFRRAMSPWPNESHRSTNDVTQPTSSSSSTIVRLSCCSSVCATVLTRMYPNDLFAAVLQRVFGEAIADVEASDRAPRDRLEAFLSKAQKYWVLHREAYERMEESEALRAVYSGLLQWLED